MRARMGLTFAMLFAFMVIIALLAPVWGSVWEQMEIEQ